MLQLESKGEWKAEFPFPWGSSVFFLLRISTDWMRPTYVVEENQLSLKSTDLNEEHEGS